MRVLQAYFPEVWTPAKVVGGMAKSGDVGSQLGHKEDKLCEPTWYLLYTLLQTALQVTAPELGEPYSLETPTGKQINWDRAMDGLGLTPRVPDERDWLPITQVDQGLGGKHVLAIRQREPDEMLEDYMQHVNNHVRKWVVFLEKRERRKMRRPKQPSNHRRRRHSQLIRDATITILGRAKGLTDREIAEGLDMEERTVQKARQRFEKLAGLWGEGDT